MRSYGIGPWAVGVLVCASLPAWAGTTRNDGGGNLLRYFHLQGEVGCFTSLQLVDQYGGGWSDGGDVAQNTGATDTWSFGGVSIASGYEFTSHGAMSVDVNGGWNLYTYLGVYVDSANCNQGAFDLNWTYYSATHGDMELFYAPSGTGVSDYATQTTHGLPGTVFTLADGAGFDGQPGSQTSESFQYTVGVHLPATYVSPAGFGAYTYFELLPNF